MEADPGGDIPVSRGPWAVDIDLSAEVVVFSDGSADLIHSWAPSRNPVRSRASAADKAVSRGSAEMRRGEAQ